MSFSRKKEIPALRPRCRSKAKKRRKSLPVVYRVHWIFPTIFIVAMVAFITMYLCSSSRIISVQYRMSQLKEHRKELLAERNRIQLDIEKLEALERIETIAREELKMVEPLEMMTLSLKRPVNTAELPFQILASP